jgi:hypothetical protein
LAWKDDNDCAYEKLKIFFLLLLEQNFLQSYGITSAFKFYYDVSGHPTCKIQLFLPYSAFPSSYQLLLILQEPSLEGHILLTLHVH